MQAVIINNEDIVAVALEAIPKGTEVSLPQGLVTVTDDIPRGHKFALCDIKNGDPIIKYG